MQLLGEQSLKEEDNVEVTWDDQQRINTFSKLNSRYRILEAKLEGLKNNKEALDDVSNELELADEDEPVLYRIGENFVHLPHAQATKRLERDVGVLDKDISKLKDQMEECEKSMKELKIVLYTKFGSAINLDE